MSKSWFMTICRNAGLMVHNITEPVKTTKQQVCKTTQEKKISDTVTLRRTTIEEIEMKADSSSR